MFDELKKAMTADGQLQHLREDEVRVLRIIEYRGPRNWVEKTLSTSITGVREVSPGKTITVTTLGLFPEILKA